MTEAEQLAQEKKPLLTPDGIRSAAKELREASAKGSGVSLDAAGKAFFVGQAVLIAEMGVGASLLLTSPTPATADVVSKTLLPAVGLVYAELPFFGQQMAAEKGAGAKELPVSTSVLPWIADRMDSVANALDKVVAKRSS